MGLFSEKSRKFDPLGVAQVLGQSFVEKADDDLCDILAIPPSARSSYDSKSHLYRLASTITALLVQEETYPKVSEIRVALETLVFGQPYDALLLDGASPMIKRRG